MKRKSTSKSTGKSKPKVPYHYQPENLSLEQWQKALREQFVKDKYFGIEKLDNQDVFGDYLVHNPEKKTSYKVALRSKDESWNFCSCMDFKTNHLGTCKHIQAVMHKIQSNPKHSRILEKGYKPSYTSVFLHYKGERTVNIRIGLDHKARYSELAKEYFDENNRLRPDKFLQFETFLGEAKKISDDFRCYDDAIDFILNTRENQRREKLITDKFPTSEHINGVLKAELFPYQKEGVWFAVKKGRALIADEMGLGKTIQAIAAADMLQKEVLISNVLIVCPTSLKYQWAAEIRKFSNNQVLVIEGLPHHRKEQYQRDVFYKIVSYHTLKNDVDIVNQTEVDLVILDEAQRIKNWKTQLAQGVKKIDSRYAVVLTGTPLENKLEELYSIVQFVDPFKLGPYHEFLAHYQEKNETGKVIGYKNLNQIGILLSDIMIRRNKKEVLKDLPERIDQNLLVPMTETQMDWHEGFQSVVARLVFKWKRFRFLNEQDRQKLLINLNLMRMVCDSTFVIDQQTRHDTKVNELMSILDEYLDGNKEKAVVFSQWARMTSLLAGELDQKGIRYQYLHGGVPSAKRKELFEKFNNDPQSRIFLSTDAGSTGLNLQSASLLINMDIPWNPAILEQRIARIHRIGQKNKIRVLNFVSAGTIEHRMLDVLKFKSSLAEGILDKGDDVIFLSDSKFNQFMNSVSEMVEDTDESPKAGNTISSDEKEEQLEMIFREDEENKIDESDSREKPLPKEHESAPKKSLTQKRDNRASEQEEQKPENNQMDEPGDISSSTDSAELINQGIKFFSGLATTLSSQEKTQKLVASITEKDEKSGQTYLKIPVESQNTVEQALNLLGQFMKGIGK